MLGAMDPDALTEALERVAVGAVGMTNLSLGHAGPGDELTFQQWRALVILGQRPDGARIGEVAARVGVTVPATSRLLRRLARRGLVDLATDPGDRRAIRASLSTHGQAVREAILSARRVHIRAIAELVDGREPGDLKTGLEAIAAAFDRFA